MTKAWAQWVVLLSCCSQVACSGVAEEAGAETEELGAVRQSIINGLPTSPLNYPWQAELIYDGAHNCGGSILSKEWIVTAAHCITGKDKEDFEIRLGVWDRLNFTGVQTASVAEWIVHPEYRLARHNEHSDLNDIALIRLDHPLAYSSKVQPIALSQETPAPETSLRMSGWGWAPGLENVGDHPRYLRMGELEVLDAFDEIITVTTQGEDGPVSSDVHKYYCEEGGIIGSPTAFCGSNESGTLGGSGDSGGPAIVAQGEWHTGLTLAGITSFGDLPGYTGFTDVSLFREWILAETGGLDVFGDVDSSGCSDQDDRSAILAQDGNPAAPNNEHLDLVADGTINLLDRIAWNRTEGWGCE